MKRQCANVQYGSRWGITRSCSTFVVSFLTILLAACTSPDFVSEAGVRYYYEADAGHWAPDEINAQEQGFIQEVAGPNYPMESVRDALAHTEVTITADHVPCPWASETGCNGLQDGYYLTVRNMGCPGASALTHEMAHLLQQTIHGWTDYKHTETALWELAEGMQPGSCHRSPE